jgi:hypothetical protein
MLDLEEIKPDRRGLDEPRYKENPIYLFFEDYILDAIGELPKESSERIQSMDLAKVFDTPAESWQGVIIKVLDLSGTIEVAIKELWYRNREKMLCEGKRYHPLAFAQDFVDHYMEEGSQVDVWTPETLASARVRIESYENGE